MMTDERQGEGLWRALDKLPEGSGVVFRHYSLAQAERRRAFDRVRGMVGSKACLLVLAGPPSLAALWGSDGSHGWEGAGDPNLVTSLSVHNAKEMEAANRLKPDLVFISPVFETRSHPGKPALGLEGLSALAALATMPAVALGGMNGTRAKELPDSVHGWAAIDGLTD
jgi:thiamine-phosphate pyrophosphorylase